MFAILALLGVFCLLAGLVLFVVGGFQSSVLWGLIALILPPIIFVAGLFVGAAMGLMDTSWAFGAVVLASLLPWFALMITHWDKAKNGFLLFVAGFVFFAAGFVSIDAATKQKMAAGALAYSAKSGQPVPPAFADWLGIKKPATAADKPGAAASPDAKADATVANSAKAGPDTAASPAAGAPVGLENEAQVTAAVLELNDRAAKLKARKDMLRGSTDQLGIAALAEEIKQFNERLKVVTARQVELKMIPPPPTPTPAPAIPPTVVIPPSTPTPPPGPKKK